MSDYELWCAVDGTLDELPFETFHEDDVLKLCPCGETFTGDTTFCPICLANDEME